MDSNIEGKVFQTFSETAGTLDSPALQSWKKQGGKVVGYFCSAVPEVG
jgi:benzoyl-CoA reductase/2-hydroxyglutaryl-CoA dehydratase subunit BcrC/BadD/HgdB